MNIHIPPDLIIAGMWGFILLGVIGLIWLLYFYFVVYNKQIVNLKRDIRIFFKKDGTFEIKNIKSKNGKFEYNKNNYIIPEKYPILNKFGKPMTMHSEGKISPAILTYDKQDWVSIDNLKVMLNNELLKEIFKPKDRIFDILIIVTCIASVIGCISSTFMALKYFKVIK